MPRSAPLSRKNSALPGIQEIKIFINLRNERKDKNVIHSDNETETLAAMSQQELLNVVKRYWNYFETVIFSIIDLAGAAARRSRWADLTSTHSAWLLKIFQSETLKLFKIANPFYTTSCQLLK